MLVSRSSGVRRSGQCVAWFPVVDRPGPVVRNPRSSRLTAPRSQDVRGPAPMRMKMATAGNWVVSPVNVFPDGEGGQLPRAMGLDYLGRKQHPDIGGTLQFLDKVRGHAVEGVAPDQEAYMFRVAG